MKFKYVEAREKGKFLHRYNFHYENADGTERVYEAVSRCPDIRTHEDLLNCPPDAVVVMITDEKDERILLDREYRLELGRHIIGMPGGLIDPGETAEEAAARELKEETGLTLTEVRCVFPPAFCAVGLSNESTVCVFGKADGEIDPDLTTGEETNPRWYTRDEVKELHRTERFGSWSMFLSWVWVYGTFPGNMGA